MTDAREEILARIRAVRRPAVTPVERTYRRRGVLPPEARVNRFQERVSDYRADVRRIAEADAAATIAAVCAERGAHRIAIPAGLPQAWRPPGLALVDDPQLGPAALDALDGALTGCTLAIAETGTIVLTGGSAEGRRALTLVPDLHICVLRESQIVEVVPEAVDRLRDIVAAERRPVTFVSGPSATSDIELSRVEGVHGPRNLVVLILS